MASWRALLGSSGTFPFLAPYELNAPNIAMVIHRMRTFLDIRSFSLVKETLDSIVAAEKFASSVAYHYGFNKSMAHVTVFGWKPFKIPVLIVSERKCLKTIAAFIPAC